MSILKSFKRFTAVFMFVIFTLSILTVNLSAQTQPWSPYSKYIPNETPVEKRQLRGTWISTVVNLDWPSKETRDIKKDSERIQKSKDELVEILDKAVEMNMNSVFFQVSPEGDAFFKSSVVPWSRYLTGIFGKDPGFDPLAFAIEEAHKRNLELHAWFNPYRVTVDTSEATKASLNVEKSVYKEHPEWIKTSMSRFVVDPGIPEAREWVMNRVMEVVDNYDVDGVHFDDYFYYESRKWELGDEGTFSKYNNGRFSNLGDFRRNNTYVLVKELSKKITEAKSWVKFGISPAGVWGNKSDHPGGSNTKSSFTNYDESFADTKKWVEEELIDYIAPQIYFSYANPRASYGEVASWWSEVVKGKKVHLYIGQAFYKINDDTDSYFKGEKAVPELSRQLKFNIAKPEVMGTIMFRVKNFNDEGKRQASDALRNNLWSYKALVPAMPWKTGTVPDTPTQGDIEATSYGLKLNWTDNHPDTSYYAVYRFNTGERADIASGKSAANLIGTVRKGGNERQEFTDYSTSDPDKVFYIVTALDRLHNESGGLTISINQSDYFQDVGEQYAWAVKSIDDLYQRGVIKGVGDDMFNPGQNTKRGDFTLMVIKALNLKADFEENFSDVLEDSYYFESIGTAKKLDIVKGYGDFFKPDANITREDMMVIVMQAVETAGVKLEKAGKEQLAGYSDAGVVSGYAAESVATLTKYGIIKGAGGEVKPKDMATRAEIAVILDRILDVIEFM